MTVSATCALDQISLRSAITDTYDYDAFGNKINFTGTTPNNYLYRGEQYDSDLGLYYLRARYYNPNAGRFVSADPEEGDVADPETLHRYSYAGGDPVDALDPTGRAEVTSYGQFTLWDAVKTFAKAAVVSGIIDCLNEFAFTKFTGSIEEAFNGGSISQVGPCVWIFTQASRKLPHPSTWPYPYQWPYPLPPGTTVPGTPNDPPNDPKSPRCRALRAAVDAAKTVVRGLGACVEGMSPWQVQIRYDAWIGLGAARAAEDQSCFNGGNFRHQEEEETAWEKAQECALLKMRF